MQLFVQKDCQQTGPFAIEQIRSGLADGTYHSNSLAWYEGAPSWIPLSAVPGIGGNPPAIAGHALVSQTSTLAVWSLVLGILGFVTLGLTSIPAVICGHIARGKIRRSGGFRTGGGLAVAGLVTGYCGFVLLGIAGLAGLTAPMVIRQRKKADQTEAVMNARQIGMALQEFELEYGSYPTAATHAAVAQIATDEDPQSSNSANSRYRQLIDRGMVQSETMFFAKAEGVRRPDNQFEGNHALEPGECGFGYIESPGGSVPRPVVVAPLIPGTDRFDPKPFNNKAIIGWSDGAVTSMVIDRSNGQVMKDGVNLLDPRHPVWERTTPVLLLPE